MLFHKDMMCISNCTATFGALCGPSASVALPARFPLEVFEMLITSPLLFFFLFISPPDSSTNYIRQLETKVRILEDDNNKLLSQVRLAQGHTHTGTCAMPQLAHLSFRLNVYPR